MFSRRRRRTGFVEAQGTQLFSGLLKGTGNGEVAEAADVPRAGNKT